MKQSVCELECGVTKWFDNKKGYGFIARDSGTDDVFVHFSSIVGDGFKTLEQGDRVQFSLTESERGLKAVTVIKVVPA